MVVLWLIHLRTGNASLVDAGWAGGLAMLGVLYASLGEGYLPRRALIGCMAAIWGFRLALFLLVTRVVGHPEEAVTRRCGESGSRIYRSSFSPSFNFRR